VLDVSFAFNQTFGFFSEHRRIHVLKDNIYNKYNIGFRSFGVSISDIPVFPVPLDTYWRNPQFQVHLRDVDDLDKKDTCTIVVALMEKEKPDSVQLAIGFDVYEVGKIILDEPGCRKVCHAGFDYDYGTIC